MAGQRPNDLADAPLVDHIQTSTGHFLLTTKKDEWLCSDVAIDVEKMV